MPFEIAPITKAPPIRKAPFQHYADAILRGCAMSKPLIGDLLRLREDGIQACALGAMALGFGVAPTRDAAIGFCCMTVSASLVSNAYAARYGRSIERDNDDHGYAREEIAARIAAL